MSSDHDNMHLQILHLASSRFASLTMILPITLYPDPVLRTKGKPVAAVTDDIRRLAEDRAGGAK